MIALAGVFGGLLMPLVFIPTVIFPFVFSKLSVFQIIVGCTFPAYLLLAYMAPEYRPGKHRLFLGILSYFAAVTLSVFFAVDPARAWWGNQERMNGLFTLLHFLAWLTMTTSLIKTWSQWKVLLNYQAVLAVIMALIALWQKADPMLLGFEAGTRVGGLLDNPIYMGAYQIFNVFFLALLFLKTSSWKMRAWYAIAFFIDMAAFFAGQSRGALLGLAVGVVVFAGYYGLNAGSRRARFGILGLALTAFLSYGVLYAFRDTAFVRGSVFGRLTNFNETVDTRLIAWRIAWDGFKERPITGWGFDNFHILFNQRYNPHSMRFGSYETWFDRSHNTVLDALAMTGALGTVTFFGIFLMLFYSVWHAYREKWIDLPSSAVLFSLPVAYFVQNLFVFDHPAAFSMSYLLYAFVIAATSGPFFREHDPDHKPVIVHDFPWITGGIVYVVCLGFVWTTSVQPFKASQLSIRANQFFGTQQGLEYALEAEQIWTPYGDEQAYLVGRNFVAIASQSQMGRVYQPQKWAELVERLLLREFSRHPQSANLMLIYARYLEMMAGSDQAKLLVIDEWYQRLTALSPRRQQFLYARARFLLRVGRVDDALAIYTQVRDNDPLLGEGHWMLGITQFYDKRDFASGAAEILLSQTVRYPYQFQDVRELAVMMHAAAIAKQPDIFPKMFARMDAKEITDVAFFDQAKTAMVAAGYTEQAAELQTRLDAIKRKAQETKEAQARAAAAAASSTYRLKK